MTWNLLCAFSHSSVLQNRNLSHSAAVVRIICIEWGLLLRQMHMETFGGDNFLMQNSAQHKYVCYIFTGHSPLGLTVTWIFHQLLPDWHAVLLIHWNNTKLNIHHQHKCFVVWDDSSAWTMVICTVFRKEAAVCPLKTPQS